MIQVTAPDGRSLTWDGSLTGDAGAAEVALELIASRTPSPLVAVGTAYLWEDGPEGQAATLLAALGGEGAIEGLTPPQRPSGLVAAAGGPNEPRDSHGRWARDAGHGRPASPWGANTKDPFDTTDHGAGAVLLAGLPEEDREKLEAVGVRTMGAFRPHYSDDSSDKISVVSRVQSDTKRRIVGDLAGKLQAQLKTDPALRSWLDRKSTAKYARAATEIMSERFPPTTFHGTADSEAVCSACFSSLWNGTGADPVGEYLTKLRDMVTEDFPNERKAVDEGEVLFHDRLDELVLRQRVDDALGSWGQDFGGSECEAMIHAAALKFGLGDSLAPPQYGEESAFYDAFVDETYKTTQVLFAQQGVTGVHLMRGMRWSATRAGQMAPPEVRALIGHRPTEIEIESNPLSSWTTEHSVASDFTLGTKGPTAKLGMVVPVADVFSTSVTGPGCLNEAEMIVIGHKGHRATVSVSE